MASFHPGRPVVSRQATLPHGTLSWLECNGASIASGPSGIVGAARAAAPSAAPPIVLLHGIGSCAASWREMLTRLSAERRVLAWDAPGYAASVPLPMDEPRAADYAHAAAAWLTAAEVAGPIVIGHSLGALMAAALAARGGITALVLVSPAQGYANATPTVRATKFNQRVDALRSLGRERLAAERSARLCAPGAAPEAVAQVHANMLAITERGYSQAAWMLANDDIASHLAAVRCPVAVLCGEHDVITPPAGAKALAERVGAPFHELPAAGHACYVEAPQAFEATLRAALGQAASR